MMQIQQLSETVPPRGAVLVRLATVEPFVAFVKAKNLDPEPTLQKFNMTIRDITDSERLLHPDAIYGIVNNLADAIADPFLGVHVGEDIDFEAWPIWSSYYGPSSNLFAAFTHMIQSAARLSNSVKHRLVVGSTFTAYSVYRTTWTLNPPAHVDGFFVATKLRFFDRMDSEKWDPANVTFETSCPEAVPLGYRGINVERADPGRCQLLFPTAWLLRPFVGSFCRHDNEDQTGETPSLTSAIELIVPDLLANRGHDLKDAVAARLGLPVAEMNSALRELDTTFKREIQKVRIKLARRALEKSDEPVTEIALRLGFAETASFSRFFKSHAGVTPSDFRSL